MSAEIALNSWWNALDRDAQLHAGPERSFNAGWLAAMGPFAEWEMPHPLTLTPDALQGEVLAGIDRILRVPFLSDEDRKILTAQKILWGKGGGSTADLLAIYNTL